jgi:hypothetical protein
MPAPSTGSPDRLGSVRTPLVGSPCPVLRPKRWRQTHSTQDPEIRAALEAIAQLVQHTLGRLEKGDPSCSDRSSPGLG